MIYAPTLIILMYKSFYLMKRCFCYPILKATCFVTTGHDEVKTWRQDDACIVKRNIQSLIYHPEFFVPFTKQLNWHYISWQKFVHILSKILIYYCMHFVHFKKKNLITLLTLFYHILTDFFFQNAKTTPPPPSVILFNISVQIIFEFFFYHWALLQFVSAFPRVQLIAYFSLCNDVRFHQCFSHFFKEDNLPLVSYICS